MKKLLTFCLASCLTVTAFTGCGSASGTSSDNKTNDGEKKTELIFADYEDIGDCNPHLYTGSMWFQEMVYETLVSVENTGIEPCLAESWTISDDGLVYTFKIREGVKFTDGNICDANAVEANFDALWDNIDRHVWMESARLVESYEATEDYTFVIKLSEPYYPLLTELGVTRPYAIASPATFKDGLTKDGVTEYVGTGPYMMEEHVQDEHCSLVSNKEYWGDKPSIPTVTVKVIPENQTRILALEKGEIDLIYSMNMLDSATLEKYADSKDFNIATSEPTLTKHLILNTSTTVTGDVAVRKALNHAIDKQAISEGVFLGLDPAADTLYAKNVPYCDIPLEPYAHDVKLAEKLLDDAGWVKGSDGIRVKDGVRCSMKFVYDNNSVTDKTICEYVQAEMKKIGMEINLEGYERQTYFDMLKQGSFDIAINIPWGNPYDPHAALSAMRGPVYGDYEAQLGLPDKAEIDKAISDVLVSVDETERQELYTYVLTALHEDAVYIPLVYETNKALFNKDLKNVEFVPSVYVTPFWDMTY